jgi:hypothetical protein
MKKTLLAPVLLLLALCGCGSREEGMRLHLGLVLKSVRGAEQGAGATRTFFTAQGHRITLTRAYVTVQSVEIRPCPRTTTRAWRWLRALSPIGTAEAHTVTNPMRLGTPHVSALAQAEAALELGTLQPAPGSYCTVFPTFAPADSDAEGLPSDVNMTGQTLLLEGEVVPASGGAAQPFRLVSSGSVNVNLALEGLTLSEEAPEASRAIVLAYDRWFDGVDLTSPEAAQRVLENIAGTASVGAAP